MIRVYIESSILDMKTYLTITDDNFIYHGELKKRDEVEPFPGGVLDEKGFQQLRSAINELYYKKSLKKEITYD